MCVYYVILFPSSSQIAKCKEKISKIVIKFDDVETVPELYYVPIEHVRMTILLCKHSEQRYM